MFTIYSGDEAALYVTKLLGNQTCLQRITSSWLAALFLSVEFCKSFEALCAVGVVGISVRVCLVIATTESLAGLSATATPPSSTPPPYQTRAGNACVTSLRHFLYTFIVARALKRY